jgi:hypothetical protein
MDSTPRTRTVLLLTYHFHPSFEIGARRVTALARHLTAQGLRVVVVSQFGGKEIPDGGELWPGIVCIPVAQPRRLLMDTLVALKRRSTGSASAPSSGATPPTAAPASGSAAPRRGLLGALRDRFFKAVYFVDMYKKWGWRASRAGIDAARRYGAELVISSGPPHSVLLAGTRIARKLRIPHIVDFRDPWADYVASIRPKPDLELKLLRRLERWVIESAAAITSTGATVANLLSSHYASARAKMHVIRNGFDGEIQPAPPSTGGRLSILFAGELYAGRNPFPLLTALETLVGAPEIDATAISVTFMGRCEKYAGQSLPTWLEGKRCASVVTILPQMPQEAVAKASREATVLLNLAQNQPLSVPAKTFEHLASGREVLLVCENDSETAQLVAGIAGVMQVDQADPEALLRVLTELYRRHVVEQKLTAPSVETARKFSRESANGQFLAVIRSLLPALKN